jgi:cell division protein FtsX
MVAAFAPLLLAGCGGGGNTAGSETVATGPPRAKLVRATLTPPSGCFLTVFLSESVTSAQRRDVQSLLLANRRIREIAFVPKALALERFARSQPDLARNMNVNPFPDQFEVVPGTRVAVFAIVTQFAQGVDGVTNVKASPPCGQQ